MDIVTRLKKYMAHIGLPSTQFADFAGIPRPTVSQILNGRNKKISNELISKLHDAFPSLNILWLMFGDGDMEVKTNIAASEPKKPQEMPNQSKSMPMYETLANQPQPKMADTEKSGNSNLLNFEDEEVKDNFNITDCDAPIAGSTTNDTSKKIKYIMVFYNDNTFEVLTPAAK